VKPPTTTSGFAVWGGGIIRNPEKFAANFCQLRSAALSDL
jgi:hypothetical protein